jgi:ribosome small subunit-dependent GTPase A
MAGYMQGKIIRGIAGFYYVHTVDGVYECKARGVFRKDNRKPLVGDDVVMDVVDPEEKKGNIVELLERKSELIRPAVANVDQALVIFAVMNPEPNFNLLDRFLILMAQQGLPCVICFNKADLDQEGKAQEAYEIYKNSGCKILVFSAKEGKGTEELEALLKGKTTTVAGPSGVGKSTLINSLQKSVVMETGAVSEKIKRGKHTTRHTELIAIDKDTYILDTPGFSSLGLFDLEKEDLAGFYPEFVPFERYCRFGGCSHISEPDCGVKEALQESKISPVRYENYCLLYEELKQKKRY